DTGRPGMQQTAFERTEWVASERTGWEVGATHRVLRRPSGVLMDEVALMRPRPVTFVPQAPYAELPSPDEYAAAVADMLERCPQLAALAAEALSPESPCDELGYTECRADDWGAVRVFEQGWSGSGID